MKNIVAVVAGVVFFSLCAVFLLTSLPSGSPAQPTTAEPTLTTTQSHTSIEIENQKKVLAELKSEEQKLKEKMSLLKSEQAKKHKSRHEKLDKKSERIAAEKQSLEQLRAKLESDKLQLEKTKVESIQTIAEQASLKASAQQIIEKEKNLKLKSDTLQVQSDELELKKKILEEKEADLNKRAQELEAEKSKISQQTESQTAVANLQENKSRKPRIAIVSLYYEPSANPNQLEIVSLSLRNKLTYAHKHGYNYLFYHNNLVDKSKSPHWSKIIVLQHYLEMGEWDWLFWVDLDTVIMDMDKKLEDFINVDPDINLILNKDHNGLNNGVFMVRSCEWSIWYMKKVMEQYPFTKNHGWKEQQAQSDVHKKMPETEKHIKWVPQRAMNSYSDGGSMYQSGDFLIHFPGKSASDKASFMRNYYSRSYKYSPDLQMWTVSAVKNA